MDQTNIRHLVRSAVANASRKVIDRVGYALQPDINNGKFSLNAYSPRRMHVLSAYVLYVL